MNKKIITVIVNWNRKKAIKNLLLSLREINYTIDKIIVVDNASTDGSLEMLKEEFSEVLLVENRENLGGTGGFNTGMKKALKAGCDYIWLLDNDVEVEKDALNGLIDIASRDGNIGIVGSTICYLDYKDYIFEIGGYFNWARGMLKPNKKNFFYNKTELNDIYEVDYCGACSLLVNVKALSDVGLMDESFFLTGDDLEWTYRFKRKGYRVVATPLSKIYHQTKVVVSANYMYYNCRNTFYLYSRFSPQASLSARAVFFNFFLYSFLLEEARQNSFSDLMYIYTNAFSDVMKNKMGKALLRPIAFEKKDFLYKKEILDGLRGKIVINCVDVEDEVVEKIFDFLKRDENTKLLLRSDKKRLAGYEEFFFRYDYKNILDLFRLIFYRRFDWAICFEEQRGTTLASLLARRLIVLNKNGTADTRILGKTGFALMLARSFFNAIKFYFSFVSKR